MSDYTESLRLIRAARRQRDAAAGDLYRLKLQLQRHGKDLRKAGAGYLKADAQVQRRLEVLRARLAQLLQALAKLASAESRKALAESLQAVLAQEAAYAQEANAAQQALAQTDDAATRVLLARRLAALRERLAALAGEAERLRGRLAQAERAAAADAAAAEELAAQVRATQAEIHQLVAGAAAGGHAGEDGADGQEGSDALRGRIRVQQAAVAGHDRALQDLIDGLYLDMPPQRLLAHWDDSLPIALFPLRLETKYTPGRTLPELRVRVFPDDIAIVTHEKVLTATEVEYGAAYWKALWAATDEETRKTAWRIVADKFGGNRAAWVARATRPLNWGAAGLAGADELQFPAIDITKPAAWTEAPHTRILPDRFVLLGLNGGKIVRTIVGRPVHDIVTLGPAPMGDGDKPSLTRDPATGRLLYAEDFQWVADFEQAVQAGLGFTVDFESAEAARAGFEQLLVLGLKGSADEHDGRLLLEALLENHHYSRKGLALVPQGTPTNNTEESDAGYSSRDALQSISYYTEALQPLFEPTDDKGQATDGQRLAEYLGIDYSVLQHVAHADARDHVEAVAMNEALYAGTLGYFAGSMLNDVLDERAQGQLRHHFTRYVTGRGPLATLRIGNQPYGILPTAPFSRWSVAARGALGAERPGDGTAFHAQLHRVLATLAPVWQRVVPRLAQLGQGGDASASLMAVLGLQPTSVAYFQRIGVSLDYLRNLQDFHAGESTVWDLFKSQWDTFLTALALRQLGYRGTRADGTAKPTPLLLQLVFQRAHTRLQASNLVDALPLAEDRGIEPYDKATGRNYIDWLAGADDAATLEAEDFGGAPKPRALLYMMLRYALLHEAAFGIAAFLGKHAIDSQVLLRSRKFANISATPTVSHWEVFQAPVAELVPAEASMQPLFGYLLSSRFDAPADRDVVANLRAHRAALGILRHLPTARLERAFAEHLDTLTYRLDAWQGSLFDVRLREQRRLDGKAVQRRLGQYLGAYGYLENVRPAPGRRTRVAEDELPSALREHRDNLYVESGNGGYVHAPSLNHATAAAILRNAYLTHAGPAERELMTVNLSSERVRRAHAVVEGLRNGQTLEVLLGYQFERGMHDWSTRAVSPVVLNDLVPSFRDAFPIRRTRVPQSGNTTGPEETVTDFHVVDGLALARTQAAFPWGVSLPALDPAKVSALQAEKAALENTLDALRDLQVAESAYQMAMGNFDRAAAVMQSLGSGEMATEIEVIESARGTDLAFTQRVALHLDPALAANPWPAVTAPSLRARVEPALNHWLGTLLGTPERTRCRIGAVDEQGQVLLRGDGTALAATVSLQHLQVQPLDLLFLVRNRLESSGASELEARVRQHFLQAEALPDETFVRIDFADADAGGDPTRLSFAELLPLAHHLRELVTGSQPLGAASYSLPSKATGPRPADPEHIDVTELRARVQDLVTRFDLLAAALPGAVADLQALGTVAAADALRSALRALANAGMPFAWPESARGAGAAAVQSLLAQAGSLRSRLDALTAERTALLAKAEDAATGPAQQVAALAEAAKLMLGADFLLLPRFQFADAPEVAAAFAARDQLLVHARDTLGRAGVMDEFLHGVAQVRPRMHRLEMVRLLAEALGGAALEAEALQLPFRSNDTWLAVDFPQGTAIQHDTLSFALLAPQGFQPAAAQCGLLIDQWTEAIPNAEEVTGITFNYNNPNSMPPQAVLLAVAPQLTGHWQWDHLVEGVLDTMARARQRAVEPDQIDAAGAMTTLLPALVSEFSTTKSGLSLDHGHNLEFVAARVNVLAAKE